MIAQGLAVKRLDLVRGMVISNTAAKIGTAQMWEERIAAVRAGGIEALADAVMERWFSKAFRQTEALTGWRNMLVRQPAEGYIGCGAAIAGTDFYTTTATLTLPTLAIAGTEDGSTPPTSCGRRRTSSGDRGSIWCGARGICPAWRSPGSMPRADDVPARDRACVTPCNGRPRRGLVGARWPTSS